MISGSVSSSLEARISIVVKHAQGPGHSITAVLDTGFNGFLTLPPATIASLGLVWSGVQEATLADGSVDLFDVYDARVLWHGQWRKIEADAVDAIPLAGMALLEKSRLEMEVVPGGLVAIHPLA